MGDIAVFLYFSRVTSPIHATEFLRQFSSGFLILLLINLKLRLIFHISSGRVVGNILNRVSLSNIFSTLLSPARFYQICQAAFGHYEH